jgi:hypothetical protein
MKLVYICPYNSVVHGMMFMCQDPQICSYVFNNNNSYFKALVAISLSGNQNQRNSAWISFLLEKVPSRFKEDNREICRMNGDAYDITDDLFKGLSSYTLNKKCSSCGTIKQFNRTFINSTFSSKTINKMGGTAVESILRNHAKCQVCKNSCDKTFDFGVLVLINSIIVNEGNIMLEDVPEIIQIDGHDYYFKFLIDYEKPLDKNGIGHYLCYCLSESEFIQINDLKTSGKKLQNQIQKPSFIR